MDRSEVSAVAWSDLTQGADSVSEFEIFGRIIPVQLSESDIEPV
jgi:hypothetical protein